MFVPLAHASEPPLGFSEALAISEQRSSKLAAQAAATQSAAAQVGRSTELPDPKLRVGIDNLPVSGSDAYDTRADFMTMRRIGLMQEFPNGDKRKARGERAAREQALEAATLEAQRVGVRQDTALAWVDLHYALLVQQSMEELVRQYQLEADTVAASVSAGRVPLAGAAAVRAALESARDRVLEQSRIVRRARSALAALVGTAAERPLGSAPDTARLAHDPQVLVSDLESHPVQRVYEEREALAASDVTLAATSAKSDWSVEVSYGQRSPNFSNMLTIMVSVDLPIDTPKRQGRDIASKASQLERARAEREEARRMHEAEVRAMIHDWEIATERSRRYQSALLPLTRERTDLALAAYRGGRGELAAVIEAYRAGTEARLSSLAVELERARAWARLNHLISHELKP